MNLREHCKQFLEDIKDPTIFELGVHWGEDTNGIMSWCNGTVDYHGFEPDSRNIKEINKARSNWKPNNSYTIIHGAISDKECKTPLYLSDGIHALSGNRMTGANSIRKPHEVVKKFSWIDFSETEEVQTYTIDDYCVDKDIKNIDFIWSDIQGCEYDMLKGAENMLPYIGIMLLEYSEIELYKGQKSVNDMLSLLGDNWELVAKDSWDIVVRNKTYKK